MFSLHEHVPLHQLLLLHHLRLLLLHMPLMFDFIDGWYKRLDIV